MKSLSVFSTLAVVLYAKSASAVAEYGQYPLRYARLEGPNSPSVNVVELAGLVLPMPQRVRYCDHDEDHYHNYQDNHNHHQDHNYRRVDDYDPWSTTGGAAGATVTPTTEAQLITYLSDSTARIIVLNKIFDFTNYYGTGSGKACKPWTCTNGVTPQMTIDTGKGECASNPTLYDITYYKSGHDTSLKVGSNKTIVGQGSNAGLKGIGLQISGVSNVIVQNIKITDINAQYVLGGDAILITGSSKVWIDHNYIARTGRQFIVTGFDPASQVTISNNYFDGQTSYSVSCNGDHYWAFLHAGSADTITMMQNYIYRTSGRGPHVGGISGYSYLHLVNNYYDSVGGHAIDAAARSFILAEGNYFKSVSQPDTGSGAGGSEYFVQTVSDAGAVPHAAKYGQAHAGFHPDQTTIVILKSSTDPIIIDDSPSSTQLSNSLPDPATIAKDLHAKQVPRDFSKRAQQLQLSPTPVKEEEIDLGATVEPVSGGEGASDPLVKATQGPPPIKITIKFSVISRKSKAEALAIARNRKPKVESGTFTILSTEPFDTFKPQLLATINTASCPKKLALDSFKFEWSIPCIATTPTNYSTEAHHNMALEKLATRRSRHMSSSSTLMRSGRLHCQKRRLALGNAMLSNRGPSTSALPNATAIPNAMVVLHEQNKEAKTRFIRSDAERARSEEDTLGVETSPDRSSTW
ncbi:hypothetical protein FRC01_001427 [Tulasnella sp. 417]|nr:hypothetical protein FRC01_001427 [Tulasnella sp. 417]